MSIALILTILKKLFSIITNKWTYFILLMIVCFLTISYLIVENKKKDKDIINLSNDITNLSNEITNLSISNTLLNDDILKISNDMRINKSFSNTVIKVVYRTNDIYYTNADDIELKLDKRDDFYNLFISNKLGAVK